MASSSPVVEPRILQLQPEELTFTGPFDNNVMSVLKILNQSDENVIFVVKSNKKDCYAVTPIYGQIKPNKGKVITVEALATGKDEFDGSGLKIDYVCIETLRRNIKDKELATEFGKHKKDAKSLKVTCKFIQNRLNEQAWGLQHDLHLQIEGLKHDQANLIENIKELEDTSRKRITELEKEIERLVESETAMRLNLDNVMEEKDKLTRQVRGLQNLLSQKTQGHSPAAATNDNDIHNMEPSADYTMSSTNNTTEHDGSTLPMDNSQHTQ